MVEMNESELLKSVGIPPAVADAIAIARRVAGYQLPSEARHGFLRYHAFVSSKPAPPFLSKWLADPKMEPKYHRHINGVLHHTQSAVASVFYHRDRILAIDRELNAALATCKYQDSIKVGSVIGVGGTLRLDFEYQAFVLGVRRVLDHLTYALSVYSSGENHSFRDWPKALASFKKSRVAQVLLATHTEHAPKFGYVIKSGATWSTRDRIAHREHVDAGCVNLGRHGLALAGGGENLKPSFVDSAAEQLSQVIARRAEELVQAVDAFLDAFAGAVRQEISIG